MCQVHDKLSFKEAVIELELVNRNEKVACDARINYLEAQVEKYKVWLSAKEWCTDPEKKIASEIFWTLDADSAVSDGQCDTTLIGADVSRDQVIDELDDEYNLMLEKICSKSQRDVSAAVECWWKTRIMVKEEELKLHDKIQDALDALKPATHTGQYKAWFQRLNQLNREKKLGYDGWILFNNQLAALVNRPDVVITPKVELKLLPDRIQYYYKRMEEKKNEFFEEQCLFQERDLDALDNDLIPVEQLVNHIVG